MFEMLRILKRAQVPISYWWAHNWVQFETIRLEIHRNDWKIDQSGFRFQSWWPWTVWSADWVQLTNLYRFGKKSFKLATNFPNRLNSKEFWNFYVYQNISNSEYFKTDSNPFGLWCLVGFWSNSNHFCSNIITDATCAMYNRYIIYWNLCSIDGKQVHFDYYEFEESKTVNSNRHSTHSINVQTNINTTGINKRIWCVDCWTLNMCYVMSSRPMATRDTSEFEVMWCDAKCRYASPTEIHKYRYRFFVQSACFVLYLVVHCSAHI